MQLPETRGLIRENVPLAPLTWLRVGGAARWLFQPKDADDLAALLKALPADIALLPMGVASNLLVRDGGFDGMVIRFGGPLASIEIDGTTLIAGAGALDQKTAQTARRAGLSGLEFFIGIPGTVGGAVRMNAGAFGGETAERLIWAETLDRSGKLHRLAPEDLAFSYRHSALPEDHIVIRAAFELSQGDGEKIEARMGEIKAEREASQPLRVATGGSTFKNPFGARAWELIDSVGGRGLRKGQAMVSEKHCNFLINMGDASAAELEGLGEELRSRVRARHGIQLEWEIKRIGGADAAEAAA